jgi:hypothetical protein
VLVYELLTPVNDFIVRTEEAIHQKNANSNDMELLSIYIFLHVKFFVFLCFMSCETRR